MNAEKKQERKVIHLYFKSSDMHYYFGSIANIFEFFTPEELGITFASLRNYVVSPTKPYENDKIIVRRGVLLAKPKGT